MLDPREIKLAKLLVNYSCNVQKGEVVFIEAIDIPVPFTECLIREVKKAGGVPLVKLASNRINRVLKIEGDKETWNLISDAEELWMKKADCYMGIRGNFNVSELSDVPEDKQKLYEKLHWGRIHQDIRVPKTKWVVLRWPSSSMAQLAGMSTEAFENFYFDACTLDYKKMDEAMQPLAQLMDKTNRVRLIGPGKTDLSFSIEGIPTVISSGQKNIPDGEVFTAPVRDSVNGVISFNTPSIYRGESFSDISFTCKNGKIIKASSSQSEKLNEILDTDEGSRFFGEFAIGINPMCEKPMKDILFDEKIHGSIHITPGNCYEVADNGNHSLIHWDLVLRQSKELGGGEMYFDDVLVRKDGLFIYPELVALNPDQLLS